MVSSRNVIATAICCFLVLQCTIVEGQRRFFPQWARNNNNYNSDSAQDPNSVDDQFGWSWGVADHHNNHRRNPQFGGGGFNNGGGGGNSFNGGNSHEDYYSGPGSFGGSFFNNGPGNSFNGNGGGFPGFGNNGFGNNGFGNNGFGNNGFGNNPGSGQQRQQQPTTTTTQAPPPTTVATPAAPQDDMVSATMVVYSDEFYECMAQCRTTNEWNPVCGSDMHDYNNVNKLNCANTCGANVQQVRRGPCRPAGK